MDTRNYFETTEYKQLLNDLQVKMRKLASTPVTDTPVTDTPVTDTPVTDTPVTDTPVTDTPTTDTQRKIDILRKLLVLQEKGYEPDVHYNDSTSLEELTLIHEISLKKHQENVDYEQFENLVRLSENSCSNDFMMFCLISMYISSGDRSEIFNRVQRVFLNESLVKCIDCCYNTFKHMARTNKWTAPDFFDIIGLKSKID